MSLARRPVVGVMGSRRHSHAALAAPLGAELARAGYHLLTGGGPGAMAEVARAFTAVSPRAGLSIGIVPSAAFNVDGRKPGYPNAFLEITIATHLSAFEPGAPHAQSRNHINALSSHALIALPGAEGTTNEIALAQRFGTPVACLGWTALGAADLATPAAALLWLAQVLGAPLGICQPCLAPIEQRSPFRPCAMADTPLLIPRLPKGLQDVAGPAARTRLAMIGAIRAVYDRFGFEPLETPALEYVDALGKFLPEQERPDEGIFALQDNDRQWIALRYDLTAPLARHVAERGQDLPLPYRRYQVGPVWRNEKPGPGRFREFTQFDADTVGARGMAADAENCIVLAEALEALGLARGQYLIKVNTRRLLDGVMARIGFAPGGGDPRALTVLRAIDKFDRVGAAGVRQLLTGGRKDESGDFTPGAGLGPEAAEAVLAFMHVTRPTRRETLIALEPLVAGTEAGTAGLAELAEIDALLAALGIGEERVQFDPGIVRGLAYYTGPVLEAALTLDIRDAEGRPRAFGSIASGGRYDGLVGRFTGQAVPATGVSIGVDRLAAALAAAGTLAACATGPVLVTVFDKARMGDYQAIAAELRAGGIRAEVYLGEGGLKAQLKYADRRGAPVAVIAGGDEFAAGTVSLKDLVAGAEAAQGASREEWSQKSRAQVSVPRAGLVAAVAAMLGPSAGR